MDRDERGQFVSKSHQSRSVRSLRTTDAVWIKLGEEANQRRITRADLIERMFSGDGDVVQMSTVDTLTQVRSLVEDWERKTDKHKYNPTYKRTVRKLLAELREILVEKKT